MRAIYSHSEAGGHEVNEDYFGLHNAEDRLIITLADGQGGQAGGGKAARLASEAVLQQAKQTSIGDLTNLGTWAAYLRKADKMVALDQGAGLTTLISLCVVRNELFGASSGDSAALLLGPDGRCEELTRNQAKNPPIGSEAAVCVSFTAKLTVPWKLLVMSDGVWKYVGWDRLCEMARRERGEALAECLVEAARGPKIGKLQDDFTLVVVEENLEPMFDLEEAERISEQERGKGRPLREILQEFEELERIAAAEKRPVKEIWQERQDRRREL